MSSEPLVVTADVAALLGFAVAFAMVAALPMRSLDARDSRVVRGLALAALGIYVFAAVSNVLEHGGVTAALDPYEDYIEILVFPLIAYALHQARLAAEVRDRSRAEQALASEHALLSTLMRISPVGAMVVDGDGRIAFANEAAEKILGLRVVEDGHFEPIDELRCASMQPGQAPVLDLFRLGSGEAVSGVLCAVETGGRRLVLSVSSAPLPSAEDGGVSSSGTLVLVLDVTEREAARQEAADAQVRYAEALEYAVDARTAELLKANRELAEANAAKQQLLANVSHELRTPLNVILGFSDVLHKGLAGQLTEEQARQVGMIREAGKHLLDIVDSLLEAQRLEYAETVVEAQAFDVAAEVRAVADMMRPLARSRGLALTVEAPERLDIESDPRLVAQVLRNLLSNAIKFTEAGSVTVTLKDLGERFSVTVEDTGVGIPSESLPRIFDAFYQAPGPGGAKREGTGLGLAICKQVADALGGAVAVDSEVGVGSTFTIVLPKSVRDAAGRRAASEA
ncbi:MAG: PAS domain-containing sensor histidine kinase [Coriobacteriia bacterium]|nr:PAS domain-containing sensor histidine kinase [Coriobacteriia bacterium]